jgi:hypothetical protein
LAHQAHNPQAQLSVNLLDCLCYLLPSKLPLLCFDLSHQPILFGFADSHRPAS